MFIWYNNNPESTREPVKAIHYFSELLSPEEKEGGEEVESLPEGKNLPMRPRLYINPQTKEMWYEYVEDLTHESAITLQLRAENQELRNTIALMQQALDDLILNGGAL